MGKFSPLHPQFGRSPRYMHRMKPLGDYSPSLGGCTASRVLLQPPRCLNRASAPVVPASLPPSLPRGFCTDRRVGNRGCESEQGVRRGSPRPLTPGLFDRAGQPYGICTTSSSKQIRVQSSYWAWQGDEEGPGPLAHAGSAWKDTLRSGRHFCPSAALKPCRTQSAPTGRRA